MEHVFQELISRLSNERLDIIPLYTAGDRASVQATVQLSIYLALPRTRNRLPTIASSVNVVRSLISLAGLLVRLRPDVVNCHYADYTTAYFTMLKPLFGYRLVISAHGSDLMEPSSVDQVLLPHVLRASDHIIGVSDALCEQARSIAGGDLLATTIHNGIDYDFWSGGRRESADHPIIVTVGSLRPVKGHDVLLQAFRDVVQEEPTAELRIIGDGAEHDRFVRLAVDLEIAHRVTFCGWLSPVQVRAELNRATVFAFPSRNEGLGLALLEAMAAGVPVVASDVGGIPEVITHRDTGFLVESENPRAFSDHLMEVLTKSPKCIIAQAREKAKSFDWHETVQKYKQILFSGVEIYNYCNNYLESTY